MPQTYCMKGMNKLTALGRGREPQNGAVQNSSSLGDVHYKRCWPHHRPGEPFSPSNVLGLSLSLQMVYMEILARCRVTRVQMNTFSRNRLLSWI